ncbi:4Fe-4S ferredoxin [Gordonibacter sp. 28C]|uniref:4Fe-4S dicluster domain-containing protein n=1 Tax=Gordonibacter sp. 28C TaxID=2078569 RepID=UPI000DF84D6D|nr:4Fe-4S dicluster domain-containing protein [Gordonibacter sp. 28C]RDB64611.1 4Fe-4S ferredoxin [Gordonibacter sp. 28C]
MKDHPVRNSIYNVYFSPTKATQTIAYAVADAIAADRDLTSIAINLTKPNSRPVRAGGQAGDVFLFAFPVYGGRVPTVLMDCIDQFQGEGAKAVVVGVYGNRDYDDALLEAADLLNERGFEVVAAGAFIGEHSMAPRVGAGRPDADDLAVAAQFGHDVAALIEQGASTMPAIKGNRPYRDGMPDADVRPVTTDACTSCGICVKLCPMGIIDADDPAQVEAGCLQCNACVKGCPEGAKHFEGEQAAAIVAMLEGNCMARKEPELFL